MEQLRNYSKQNPAASDNDPQYAILKTRAVLEQGQKDHSLNDLQVKAMREKINAMEVQLKNGSAAKSAAFNKIMTEKKCSRAEFLSLTLDQQRNALQKERAVRITDLVNERSSDLQLLQNGRYITEETFMNADIMRQISILQNPSAYRVVKNGTALPKTQISTAQLNELSAEKRQAIIESNNFEITK